MIKEKYWPKGKDWIAIFLILVHYLRLIEFHF